MRFAKIVDGQLEFAPRVLPIDGRMVYTNSASKYAEFGYKPIVLTEAPECPENAQLSYHWEEGADEVVQTWDLIEIELPDEDAVKALEILGYQEENNGEVQ